LSRETAMNSNRYVAFLRGINVGGNTLINMNELRRAFESVGFADVKTVLASGNVLFQISQTDSNALTRQIEEKLERIFGYEIGVFLRTREEIQALVKADPFEKITVTPAIRFHVTFLADGAASGLHIPYESPQKDFRVLSIVGRDLCSIVELSSTRGTPDLMKLIEKEFGKKVTTRAWNTVTKIGKLL
jgi:uncharacterized protein (DUF1697 family)